MGVSCQEYGASAPNTKNKEIVAQTDPSTPAAAKNSLFALLKEKGNQSMLSKKLVINEDNFEIQPNYLYIRYIPKGNAQEHNLLGYDSSIILSSTPFDPDSTENRDGLGDSAKVYYTAVPMGYRFPESIAIDTLKSLFLVQPIIEEVDPTFPDSTKGLAKRNNQKNLEEVLSKSGNQELYQFLTTYNVTLEQLELASYTLAGKEDELLGSNNPNSQLSKKGISGVAALSKASWSWDRWYAFGEIVTEGPTSYSAWNRKFTGEEAAYAAIFSAARLYYYSDIDGLRRPHQNKFYSVRLNIIVSHTEGPAGGVQVQMFVAEWIRIWLYKDGNLKSSEKLFATTIHELAHNAHYEHFETKDWRKPRVAEFTYDYSVDLQETWARGVEWYLTNKRYQNYKPVYYHKTGYARYGGLFEDLVDTNPVRGESSDRGYEYVSGFKMSILEKCVLETRNYSELLPKLKGYSSGSDGRSYTNSDLDNLVKYWAEFN